MNYMVISESITDKYVYYNESFYVRSRDAFGFIYVPIDDTYIWDEEWTVSWIDDLDIAYNSELTNKTNG